MATDEQLKGAVRVLTQLLAGKSELPDTGVLRTTVEKAWPLLSDQFNFQQSDFEPVCRLLETRFITTMGKGTLLTDDTFLHNEEWYRERHITWSYSEDYKEYLVQQDWSPSVISSLDYVTDIILGLLQDPTLDGEWERRGLVIGHVQSGKTANYLALLSKAADAGYKFIIVIAGIHNELRRQTQERVDSGFIGRDSDSNRLIGVSLLRPSRAMPVTVTTKDSDFNRALAKRFGMQLNSFNNTFILVIKKNASTLSNLYKWLKDLNTRKDVERISDIPMLMIDDEADNASVNTNKPELDPTRINREIRSILQLFRKKCYVGYTATPFANIFINPDAGDEKHGYDLFPEHFIYSLDAPSNYFGYQRIFLDDEGKSRFIRGISDADNWLPADHKKDTPVYELPNSLKRAIRLFLLARSIRNLRGQNEQHCSMLINVSRFVDVQREVRAHVDYYLNNLRKAIRYNYALPWEKASKDTVLSVLHQDFQVECSDTGINWADVLQQLSSVADDVKVAVVNSRSDEKLLYSEYNRDSRPLTVIAIGGLSLSRGLTLEGLTISYIHRNTQMYDTLMQMGRWFGYRYQYEDLCRIFMSDTSYDWYAHIAEATEELRDQIRRMRRERKKPGDFGLYVKSHPDTLTVTAINKMYYTDKRTFRVSYDGKLVETYIIPEDAAKTQHNKQLLGNFFETLKDNFTYQEDKPSHVFTDVPWDKVYDFVHNFQFHSDMLDIQEAVERYIREIADTYLRWDVGFISLKGGNVEPGFMVAAQTRTVGYNSNMIRKPVSEAGWYTGNKSRFSGNSMFNIGLSSEQIDHAKREATRFERKEPLFRDYTNIRGRPLLLIHLLRLIDTYKEPQGQPPFPALSVSFPNSNVVKTVEYVVGPVWLKQIQEMTEAEDDFDAEQPLD